MASLIAPAAGMAQSPAAVNLGSTATFAVLAASLVSSIPTSAITGDLGLSPATGSSITGLTSGEVTGKIYTVDASGPAGSTAAAAMLLAAKGDLTIAYNDAAGRTPVPSGPFLNPGSGNIGGLTLVAGLYKFTSALSITGSDVTLTGSATDVWIFQIASNLITGSGIKVILAGGAQAGNIYWQVGTSANLGTNSLMKGTIMADQSITMGTGARLDGRALARIAAVTLASAVVVRPSILTAVRLGGAAPEGFSLSQNFPNPFNPATSIRYSIEKAGQVSLRVFNLLGDEVATLVDGYQEAGSYSIQFSANNGTVALPSGIYYYRLDAGTFVSTRKLTLMK